MIKKSDADCGKCSIDRPLHVLHLPLDIRWIMNMTVEGQQKLGIETERFLITTRGLDNYESLRIDYIPVRNANLKWKGYPHYLRWIASYFKRYYRLVKWADVVHWQYSNRLFPKPFLHTNILKNFDLFLLKVLRKPTIAQFHGGDLRRGDIVSQTNPWWHEAYEPEFMAKLSNIAKNTQIDFANADMCFAVAFGKLPFVDAKNLNRTIVMERVLDVTAIRKAAAQVEKRTLHEGQITIVHAPSNPSAKGTHYIVSAVEALKKKYDINFVLLQDISRDEVISEVLHADIVIDVIISGDYGLFAVEAMAAGKPVIAYMTQENINAYPDDLPVISANPDTIYEVLEKLILDAELREEKGSQGPAYAQKVHSIESVMPEVLRAYRFAAQRKHQTKTIKRIDYHLEKCKEMGWQGISDEDE